MYVQFIGSWSSFTFWFRNFLAYNYLEIGQNIFISKDIYYIVPKFRLNIPLIKSKINYVNIYQQYNDILFECWTPCIEKKVKCVRQGRQVHYIFSLEPKIHPRPIISTFKSEKPFYYIFKKFRNWNWYIFSLSAVINYYSKVI